jgi:hypothetical protein
LPPPRLLAAAVSSSPPVKDKLRCSSFLLLWFAKGSPSLCYRRISSPAPVGAAPRPHRSAARSTAVAKLPRRRTPFAFELTYFFFARWAKTPAIFPLILCTLARSQARRSGRAAPFRCRPPTRHDHPPRPPCHVRTRLRYEMHQLVDQMMAGSTVQGRRRRASAARHSSSVNPAATPTCMRPGSLDRWSTALIKTRGYPFGAVHRGPVRRVHGAVHRARARPWSLDLRYTVRLWRFLLRAPE